MRPGEESVVPPIESALPGVVPEEPDAGRGKRLQNAAFAGGLDERVGRSTVGLDAPGTEQRVKSDGNHRWAMAAAASVIAALPQNRRQRPVVAEQAIPQLDAGRVDLSYRPQRRNGFC